MSEEDEKRFLVTVIKDLLGLCEMKRGKDNKAVVASNIMYVVGQYPRFLRAHWKFLKTVVNKLFEFMHEMHPGVQDMACDTFLKISQKCRRKFVILQVGEAMPFIDELCLNLRAIISDLEPGQVCRRPTGLGRRRVMLATPLFAATALAARPVYRKTSPPQRRPLTAACRSPDAHPNPNPNPNPSPSPHPHPHPHPNPHPNPHPHPHQVHVFYEAVSCMVSAQADAPTRDALLIKLMEWPNQMWCDLLAQAKATNGESLKDPNTMKQLQNIIRTNDRVATALGHPYVVQLGNIYMDLLNIYKACSEMINNAVAAAQQSGQVYIMQSSGMRAMRSVKKETLKLLETFIEKSEDNELVLTKFVPPLLDPVLVDYFQGNPDARDSEVLSPFTLTLALA